MHNRIGFNRLDRKPSHRKALHRNMITSLIKYERIKTTQAKAKEIRRKAEKLLTRARVDSIHNRRIVAKFIYEKDALNKLFKEIAPRYADRPGGYTRILKLGRRFGDAAEMVFLEFVRDDVESSSEQKSTKTNKRKVKQELEGKSDLPANESSEENLATEATEEKDSKEKGSKDESSKEESSKDEDNKEK